MHEKTADIIKLEQAVSQSFGPKAFVYKNPDTSGANHRVFVSTLDQANRIELSVVAQEEVGQGQYSIQVEVNMDKPDFDIPFAQDNLSVEEVLDVFNKFKTYV
jgi:hypothetical protein